jgi:quercetin dioxygenase-like cupin family protein
VEANVIKSRNADVEAVAVSAVEGKPLFGGDMLVKPLIKGDEMTFLEIHYAAGVGAPLHTHTHESIAYLVKGKVKSTVGSEEFIMGPGDVCRHPKGVLHGLEAIEDSVVVEIKSPAPETASALLPSGNPFPCIGVLMPDSRRQDRTKARKHAIVVTR